MSERLNSGNFESDPPIRQYFFEGEMRYLHKGNCLAILFGEGFEHMDYVLHKPMGDSRKKEHTIRDPWLAQEIKDRGWDFRDIDEPDRSTINAYNAASQEALNNQAGEETDWDKAFAPLLGQ